MEQTSPAVVGRLEPPVRPLEPWAHVCVLPTKDAGLTKFFTAPSDPRGFGVYSGAQVGELLRLLDHAHSAMQLMHECEADEREVARVMLEMRRTLGLCERCGLEPGCPDCKAIHDVPEGA